MKELDDFISKEISVSELSLSDLGHYGGIDDESGHPTIAFNQVLKEIRNDSKNIKSLQDEIKIVNELKEKLENLRKELDLPEAHSLLTPLGVRWLLKRGQASITFYLLILKMELTLVLRILIMS